MAYLRLRGPAPGPLFLHKDGHPLTRTQLSIFLQFVLSAATTAAQQGLPDHLNKTMGRWSSDAYQLHVKTPVQSFLDVSGRLL